MDPERVVDVHNDASVGNRRGALLRKLLVRFSPFVGVLGLVYEGLRLLFPPPVLHS
jgi:hypothetical protein